MIYVTPHKIADDRQDEATLHFTDDVHNCPALWDFRPLRINIQKNKQKKMENEKGGRWSLFSPVKI